MKDRVCVYFDLTIHYMSDLLNWTDKEINAPPQHVERSDSVVVITGCFVCYVVTHSDVM